MFGKIKLMDLMVSLVQFNMFMKYKAVVVVLLICAVNFSYTDVLELSRLKLMLVLLKCT